MKTFNNIILLIAIFLLGACSPKTNNAFVTIKNSQFIVNNEPIYFVGTNFWFGAILGSTGEGGDRERLIRELDFMNANGMDNLRIMIGADGANGVPSKAEPTLQTSPGVYNDTVFDGLDFCWQKWINVV